MPAMTHSGMLPCRASMVMAGPPSGPGPVIRKTLPTATSGPSAAEKRTPEPCRVIANSSDWPIQVPRTVN